MSYAARQRRSVSFVKPEMSTKANEPSTRMCRSQARTTSPVEEQWPDIDGLAPQEFIDRATSAHEGSEPVGSPDLGSLAPAGTFFDVAVLHLLTGSTLDHLADACPHRRRPAEMARC